VIFQLGQGLVLVADQVGVGFELARHRHNGGAQQQRQEADHAQEACPEPRTGLGLGVSHTHPEEAGQESVGLHGTADLIQRSGRSMNM
jgi:hypothetical protein